MSQPCSNPFATTSTSNAGASSLRGAGLAVGDPDGGVLHAEPAPFGGEPVQRPIGHHTPLPGQQFVDLHHRQRLGILPVAGQPHRDLRLAGLEGLPRCPVPVRAGRTHRRHHLGDQHVVHVREPRVPLQTGRLRGGDVPAGRLAVHPRPFGLSSTLEPDFEAALD